MSLFNFLGKKKNKKPPPEPSDIAPPEPSKAAVGNRADTPSDEDMPTRLATSSDQEMISNIPDLESASASSTSANQSLMPPPIDHIPDIDEQHAQEKPQPESPFTDVPSVKPDIASDTPDHEEEDRTVVLPRVHRRLKTDLGHLIVREGAEPRHLTTFSTEKELLIGTRDDCQLILSKERGVSRHHARISWQEDRFIIEDLASTNGTLVNHMEVAKQDLKDGDQILIGETQLIFKWTQLPEYLKSW